MSLARTVMIVGLGDVGSWALEYLARSEGVGRIITADIREEWGIMRTNSVAVGAGQQGYSKKIEFHKCDVNDIDATAELLKTVKPDVILNVTSKLGCAAQATFFPPDIVKKNVRMISIIGGLQLALAAKLMKAVKKSGVTTHVVNTSYPDLANPVLWRNGLGPLVGSGNMDSTVAEIRRKISIVENVPIRDITVYLIAAHPICLQGTRTGAPYFFKVMIGDKDITNRFDVDSLISDKLFAGHPEWSSWTTLPRAAAGAVKNIMAIINDTNLFTHAPGPNGLPGGYPIRISAKGVELALPKEISVDRAIKINTDCMKNEGIEEIKDDGTVIFTEEARKLAKETYGLDYRGLLLEDADNRAEETLAAFRRLPGWKGG